jgi:hypothetical protein
MRVDRKSELTRRSFLARGICQFSAMSLMPSLFGVVRKQALADEPRGNWIPAIIIDLNGGAALPSHFLVGGKGGPGDFLPNYDKLGWDPRSSGALNESYGLPLAANGSLLAGLDQSATAAARANLRMASYCHEADSDVSTNALSSFFLISRSGAFGNVVKRGLGSAKSPSGGNSRGALADPNYHANFISSVADLEALTKFRGALGLLAPEVRKAILNRITKLSVEQAGQFDKSDDAQRLAATVERSDQEIFEALTKVADMDARRHPAASQVFQLNSNSAPESAAVVFASLALATLTRQTGPSVLTLGGYDYHQNNGPAIAAKDRDVGVLVGRLVELAHRLREPLFVQIITDGGCSPGESARGQRIWTSDSSEACMTVNLFYHPDKAVAPTRLQYGHYRAGQGAEGDTLVGKSPERVAALTFANYLSLSNRLGEFANYVPPSVIDPNLLRDSTASDCPLLWG